MKNEPAPIWKDTKEFLNIPGYQVSNTGLVCSKFRSVLDKRQGRVYIKKGAPVKPGVSDGYKFVYLCHKGHKWKFFVHRLVALAFLGSPPEGKPTVDHIDRKRHNNHVGNLRWASSVEQNQNRELDNKSPEPSREEIGGWWGEVGQGRMTQGDFLVFLSGVYGVSFGRLEQIWKG